LGPVSSSSIIPAIKELVQKKAGAALVPNPDNSAMLSTAYSTDKLATAEVSVGKEIDRVMSNSNAHASEEQGPESSTS
jgi:hypothetical protein